ncbi:MAG: methyl-accepting chemotaxis protein [Bacteriovorax sp.]
MSFKFKIMAIVITACIVCTFSAVLVSVLQNEKEIENGIIDKSRTILSRLEVARGYVANQGGLKIAIDAALAKHQKDTELNKDEKLVILKQVPIFASMKIGNENAKEENYEFRIFSDEPREKKHQATKEELVVFKKFEADEALKEQVVKKGNMIAVYRPVRLSEEQGCLSCHGDPANSPWKNGNDILSYKMENWKDKKLHGVFGVISNKGAIKAAKALASDGEGSSASKILTWSSMASLSVIGIAFFLIRTPITTIDGITNVLRSSGNDVSNDSSLFLNASKDVHEGNLRAVASIQQTSAAIEEINRTIENNVRNTERATDISHQSTQLADAGKETVKMLGQSINEMSKSSEMILNQVTQSNAELSNIVLVISDIGEKTKIINDIVFQTRLLSFNASVEAARAGEHGKGFAVVAEEIGNLAEMSGKASRDISEMLDASLKKVDLIVSDTKNKVEGLVKENKDKIEEGVSIAEQCNQGLEEIYNKSSEVKALIEEITVASKEQAIGLKEIASSIIELEQVTQDNGQICTTTNEASRKLFQNAVKLKSVVENLSHLLSGKRDDSKEV